MSNYQHSGHYPPPGGQYSQPAPVTVQYHYQAPQQPPYQGGGDGARPVSPHSPGNQQMHPYPQQYVHPAAYNQPVYQGPPIPYQGQPHGYQGPPYGYQAPPYGYQGPPPGRQSPPVGYQVPPNGYQSHDGYAPSAHQVYGQGYAPPPMGAGYGVEERRRPPSPLHNPRRDYAPRENAHRPRTISPLVGPDYAPRPSDRGTRTMPSHYQTTAPRETRGEHRVDSSPPPSPSPPPRRDRDTPPDQNRIRPMPAHYKYLPPREAESDTTVYDDRNPPRQFWDRQQRQRPQHVQQSRPVQPIRPEPMYAEPAGGRGPGLRRDEGQGGRAKTHREERQYEQPRNERHRPSPLEQELDEEDEQQLYRLSLLDRPASPSPPTRRREGQTRNYEKYDDKSTPPPPAGRRSRYRSPSPDYWAMADKNERGTKEWMRVMILSVLNAFSTVPTEDKKTKMVTVEYLSKLLRSYDKGRNTQRKGDNYDSPIKVFDYRGDVSWLNFLREMRDEGLLRIHEVNITSKKEYAIFAPFDMDTPSFVQQRPFIK